MGSSSQQNSPTTRVIKLQDWPPIDRALWQAGTTWDTGHFLRPYAATLRPATVRNAQRAYGRMLAVLRDLGILDDTIGPAARLTPAVADLLLDAMMKAGNTNSTLKVRIFDLKAAMRIMEPGVNTGWLSRPDDVSLHDLLPITKRPLQLVGVSKLYEHGIQMMVQSEQRPNPVSRAVMLRNGLITALFACRGPRIRALASMQVGQHVHLKADECWLTFGADDWKTGKPIEYKLPPDLVPWVRRYLTVDRVHLCNGQDHKAMFVGRGGKPLGQRGIEGMYRRMSKVAFGRSFGTHQSRHEIASALADAEPTNPGLAAAVLGITPAVAEREYTHARNNDAAARVSANLEIERDRTRLLADRLFGDRYASDDDLEMLPLRQRRKSSNNAIRTVS